jgi:hypothetical protein
VVALTGIEPAQGRPDLSAFALSLAFSYVFVLARSAKCRHGGLTSWGGHGAAPQTQVRRTAENRAHLAGTASMSITAPDRSGEGSQDTVRSREEPQRDAPQAMALLPTSCHPTPMNLPWSSATEHRKLPAHVRSWATSSQRFCSDHSRITNGQNADRQGVRVFSSMMRPTSPATATDSDINRRLVESVDLAALAGWAERFYVQIGNGHYYALFLPQHRKSR